MPFLSFDKPPRGYPSHLCNVLGDNVAEVLGQVKISIPGAPASEPIPYRHYVGYQFVVPVIRDVSSLWITDSLRKSLGLENWEQIDIYIQTHDLDGK